MLFPVTSFSHKICFFYLKSNPLFLFWFWKKSNHFPNVIAKIDLLPCQYVGRHTQSDAERRPGRPCLFVDGDHTDHGGEDQSQDQFSQSGPAQVGGPRVKSCSHCSLVHAGRKHSLEGEGVRAECVLVWTGGWKGGKRWTDDRMLINQWFWNYGTCATGVALVLGLPLGAYRGIRFLLELCESNTSSPTPCVCVCVCGTSCSTTSL